MTQKTPSSIGAAIKDRHLSRQKRGNRVPKNGAGRHNWGNEMEDIEDVNVPIEEPFYDEEVDLAALQNADKLRESPRLNSKLEMFSSFYKGSVFDG
jgi:hypothetical protein